MRPLSRLFFKGLLALLPLILTVYPLYYFFRWADSISNKALLWCFPQLPYLPGMGILSGVGAILLLGVLISTPVIRRLYSLIELPFRNIPLVKTLYAAIKELTLYLAPSDTSPDQVVVVSPPGQSVQIIGFVTRSDLGDLPDGVKREGQVAVYLPLSYQIGGYTLFVPREWIRRIDMPIETAMREALTGWMHKAERASGDAAQGG